MSSTGAQKKYRDRATRLKRALAAEKRRYGGIDDGYGKRYLIGPLYALAGDFDLALAHYDWYEKECSDDVGEPVHYLWWALSLYRTGGLEKANARLLETMVQNVYLLPALLGFATVTHDMWHSSNREQPDYISKIPPEFLPELSERECLWIEGRLDTALFRRVKDEYISTYRLLKSEESFDKRCAVLRRWAKFWADAASGRL